MADEDGQISVYDEVEIEDMTFDKDRQIYNYPCPCGDKFEISLADLRDEQDIAVCPSCSLMIRVIFDLNDLPKDPEPEPPVEQQQQQPQEETPAQVAVVA